MNHVIEHQTLTVHVHGDVQNIFKVDPTRSCFEIHRNSKLKQTIDLNHCGFWKATNVNSASNPRVESLERIHPEGVCWTKPTNERR